MPTSTLMAIRGKHIIFGSNDTTSFYFKQRLPYIATSSNPTSNHPFYSCQLFASDVSYDNGLLVPTIVDSRNVQLSFINGFNETETASSGTSKETIVSVQNQIFSFYTIQPFTLNLLTSFTFDNSRITNKVIEPVTFTPYPAIKYRNNTSTDWFYLIDSSPLTPVYGLVPTTVGTNEIGFQNIDELSVYYSSTYTNDVEIKAVPSSLSFSNLSSTARYKYNVILMKANKTVYACQEMNNTSSYWDYLVFRLVPPYEAYTELVYPEQL